MGGLTSRDAIAPVVESVAEAYVTPVDDGLVGVALLGPPRTDFGATLATFPELAAHLAGAEPDAPVRGAGPLRQRTSARTRGRVRLVGDASGYVDALTGEGLRVGLAQAAAAVATVGPAVLHELLAPEAHAAVAAGARADRHLGEVEELHARPSIRRRA